MAAPRGQFGNRLDTAAGRAKEAQMAAVAQALVVAHSEAVHGRPANAATAIQTAQNTAASINRPPEAFTQAVNRDIAAIQAIPQPSTSTPGPGPSPGPGPDQGQSKGSSYSPPPPPPPKPINPWITERQFQTPAGVKQAQPDIVLDPSTNTSGDFIVERFFEELGGTELATISRYDLIDGTPVIYSPIANLSTLRRTYNPNNLISIDITSVDEFSKSSINLIERGMNFPYFNNEGNLVIEIDVVKDEEQIQADISIGGTINRIEL